MPGNVVPLPGSSIELSEGEVLVRQYHITTNKKPKARGDVAVTNKRIIYQGKGKTSTTVKEVPIETVSAINTFYGSGFKIGLIILGILAIIAGIVGLVTIITPIIAAIVAFLCFANCFNSGYSLSIKSAAVAGTGISVGASDISVSNGGFFSNLFSTSGQGASLSVNAAPTKEALQMMNELGAIVLDLKTMGDKAIAKWQGYAGQPVDTSMLNAKLSSAMPDLGALKDSIPNISITPKQPQQQQYQQPQQQYQQPYQQQMAAPPPPPPPPPMAQRAAAPPAGQAPVAPPSNNDQGFFS